MSSSVENKALDFTPCGLFPSMKTADKDPKCLVISKVYEEMLSNRNTASISQQTLREDAAKKYSYLSEEGELTIYQVDHAALTMFLNGVTAATAKQYFSHRLKKSDVKKWKIISV
ncbi:MAG: hypothetical protein VX777_02405 [Chlamydiota bacterium]|nr:hypothetical protein [Chlamydiota bacterium]